ncbi:unnamed protein product [Orchesella dallaii]|uniref:EB domain-containing protein n=1 Tax=Orchesella dallaii TaxID=48710 RepID=A0ABP1PYU9_9HEXA
MFGRRSNNIYKFFAGAVLVLVYFCNAMELSESKSIFNELIPNETSCSLAGDHGCICYNNLNCDQTKYLECIDGKCVCEFPLHRMFDETLGKCVTQVGSTCSGSGTWTPECVRNSECEIGRCMCREGYSKTSSNTCLINFGQECGPNMCNSDRGLACKEGRCQCLDSSYVYSAIVTKCIDPEAVVRDFIERISERIVREVFNFKLRQVMNKITRPFRIFSLLGR